MISYEAEKMRRWRALPGNKEREAARRHRRNRLSPMHTFKLAVFNAKKRREVRVTKHDLMDIWNKQDGKCAITGIRMTWSEGRILSTSISLDRIDQIGIYAVGNIRLVCNAVNMFRGNMSDAEMVEMARAIVAKASS